MEHENGNDNPSNNGNQQQDINNLDATALKELITKERGEKTELSEKNRQLFARAKRAEGFEQDEKGEWVKTTTKTKEKPEAPKKSEKSDEKILERLENMAMKVSGITADDEKDLYSSWKESTGREADEILGNKIFQAELTDLRTAKANQEATSNIKGEKGDSGVKNTPEYWIAKATKGTDGKLLFSDEMPKELYSKVLDKLAKDTPGASEDLKFYSS